MNEHQSGLGKSDKNRSPVTIIIASSVSRDKDSADFICDGINDEAQIRAAITLLPKTETHGVTDTYGGEIVFLEGQYNISNKIIVDRTVNLKGSGSGYVSKLMLANGADCHMFETAAGAGALMQIADLMFDGNSSHQTVPTNAFKQTAANAVDIYFINCWFNDWKGSSVHLIDRYDHRFERCIFENQAAYAIDIEATAGVPDLAPVRNWITNCFNPTVYCHGAGTGTIHDLIVQGNIFVPQFQDRTCMSLSKISNVIVTGNTCLGATPTSNVYDWLSIDKATVPSKIVITNNTVSFVNFRYIVYLYGSNVTPSDSVLISNNTFSSSAGTALIYNDPNNQINGLIITGNALTSKSDNSMIDIYVGATAYGFICHNYFKYGLKGIDASSAASTLMNLADNQFDGVATPLSTLNPYNHKIEAWGGGYVELGSPVVMSGSAGDIKNYGDISFTTYNGAAYVSGLKVKGNGSPVVIQFPTYGAGTLTTDASGNITATSDIRKKNILGEYSAGLKELRGLKPIFYRWKENTGYDTGREYAGFSAQNVRDHIPLAVQENKDGFLSLQDRPIIAALVNAVNELNDRLVKIEANKGV